MLIDIRHEEAVRACGEVPHGIDAAAHDDGAQGCAAQDVGVGRLALCDALCGELLLALLCCRPLGRLGHLEPLVPDPCSDNDEMCKDEAVAEQPEHLVHRDGGGKHDDRAEHPRNLRRAAVFRTILRRCLLCDKCPRGDNVRADREANDDVAEQEHWIVRRKADDGDADHVDEQCPVVDEFTPVLVADPAADERAECRAARV